MQSSIYYMQDINEAMITLMNNPNDQIQILSLDESLPPSPGVMVATILLPPPIAMIAESDGKAEEFYRIYSTYLGTKDVADFVNAMICFLFSGGNLILYIPPVFQDSAFVPMLFQYFYQAHGLKIGTKEEAFWYDNKYDPINYDILYSLNVMDAYTYLSVYPMSFLSMSPCEKQLIGNKLYQDIKPLIPLGNDMDALNDVLLYFDDLRIKMKDNPNLRQGLVYAEE